MINTRKAMYVDICGNVCKIGNNVSEENGIRPLMWVNISDMNLYYNVKFGQCEQDGNFENGKEDIEWLILDSKNDNN